MFNTSVVVLSPVRGSGWAGRLLGNWKLAPLVRATTGMAINVTSGRDNSLSAVGKDRPNQVLADPYPATRSPSQWIIPTAFVANPTGTFGTLGRNALRAPGVLRVDAAFSREFPITERLRLEARGEGFNVINHANFGAPSATLSSATFGRITSAGEPRILQFALKLHF
jgi:hypothetical protein